MLVASPSVAELTTHHDARGHRDPTAAVSIGNDITVPDAQERDGDQPHRVEQVRVLLVVVPAVTTVRAVSLTLSRRVPLALAQRPAGDNPQGNHEDEQHGARADGHERLQYEARVEVYPVQGSDGSRRGISEQFTAENNAFITTTIF